MAQLFFPVLSHFQNNNGWLSSDGRLRFRVTPTLDKVPEGEDPTGFVTAEVWEGPWAYEFSTVEDTRDFPLTEEGLREVLQWLDTWHDTMEGRPQRTLEENIARKKQPEPAE